jgi:hypothetical protein
MTSRQSTSFFYCLSNSSRADYQQSVIEMLFTAVFAFMPIYITALVVVLTRSQESASVLEETWTSGELLLIAVAMAGPIMYIMFKWYREEGSPGFQFPSNWFFVLLIIPIVIIASVVFCLAKFHFIPGDADLHLVKYILFAITVCLFFLIFLIITVRNMLERQDPAVIMHEDTAAYLSRWET